MYLLKRKDIYYLIDEDETDASSISKIDKGFITLEAVSDDYIVKAMHLSTLKGYFIFEKDGQYFARCRNEIPIESCQIEI